MTSRNLFLNNNWFHRLVGARGSAATSLPLPNINQKNQEMSWFSPPIFLSSNRPSNYGSFFQDNLAAQEIAKHRIVFFGEIHSRPPIIAFQRDVLNEMAKSGVNSVDDTVPPGVLHVVFEHFSFDMQPLLDDYQTGKITFDELVTKYEEIGSESHELEPYRKLLEDAKSLHLAGRTNSYNSGHRRKVQLHAGFLSRTYARLLMKEGKEVTIEKAATWLPSNTQLEGTDFHYNIFESLLTGRPPFDQQYVPDDRYRKIFQAQLLKDVAMAHKINKILQQSADPKGQEESLSKRSSSTKQHEKDKVLVLLGNGHVLGYTGVPERVLEQHPDLATDMCVLVSHHCQNLQLTPDKSRLERSIMDDLKDDLGPPGTNVADYVYIYRENNGPETYSTEPQQNDTYSPTADSVKEETERTYDKVGETAHLQGDAAKAIAIMKAMKYSEDQIAIAGSDVHNFQGVGNPHLHANIQPGETVLDVGSGLGIDSYIAYAAATSDKDDGFVIGIDISSNEVRHAQSCGRRRQLDKIRFAVADMEQIPLPDNTVDVVISNGAFCLAPDKQKAFAEVFRVLKPGGRISICTTTTRDERKLEPGVSWPICMKMFIPQNEIQPLCESIVFVDVVVDDSDSSMSIEIPQEVLLETKENDDPNTNNKASKGGQQQEKQQRNKVHVGNPEFSHLENYDMDALCARVCVVARKPTTQTANKIN